MCATAVYNIGAAVDLNLIIGNENFSQLIIAVEIIS